MADTAVRRREERRVLAGTLVGDPDVQFVQRQTGRRTGRAGAAAYLTAARPGRARRH